MTYKGCNLDLINMEHTCLRNIAQNLHGQVLIFMNDLGMKYF